MAIWRYQNSDIYNKNTIGTFKGHVLIRDAIDNNQITYKNIIMEYGTRLDIIAEKEYGDSSYWWVIAAASKIGWGLQVPEGVVLTIPNLGEVITLVYG